MVQDRRGVPPWARVHQVGVEGDHVARLGLHHDMRPLPVPEAGRGGLGRTVLAEPPLEFGQVGAGNQAKRTRAGRAWLEVRPEGHPAHIGPLAGVPGRIAGEARGDPGRGHGGAAQQFGRGLERPGVIGDERQAERGTVHRQRQVVAADAAQVVRLGGNLAEGTGQRAGHLLAQRGRLGRAEQAGQRHVPERAEMQDLLMSKHDETPLSTRLVTDADEPARRSPGRSA